MNTTTTTTEIINQNIKSVMIMPNQQIQLKRKNQGGIYTYKGRKIGIYSWDWHTFILFRRPQDLKIRRYPKTIGISTACLMDFIKKGCKLLIVRINREAKYTIDPREWIEKGIVDSLKKGQEPHAFMPLSKFKVIGE